MTAGIPKNCDSTLNPPLFERGEGVCYGNAHAAIREAAIAIASNPNRVLNPVRVCAVTGVCAVI
jgi:hypothetical protein